MSTQEILARKVAEREALLQRIESSLQSDDRVVAAWLGGSLGRGAGDAFSDLDLWVVIRDEHMAGVREERREFARCLGQPILISEAPQNAPPNGAYLWTLYTGKYGPQHVDWNWLPQKGASLPLHSILIFSKVGLPAQEGAPRVPPIGLDLAGALTQECAFFWGLCLIVGKYIARDKPFEALNLMNIVGATLSKVEWLLGMGELMPYNQNTWDPAMPPFTSEAQLTLLRDVASCMEHKYHHLIEAHSGQVPQEAVEEISNFLELVEQVLSER